MKAIVDKNALNLHSLRRSCIAAVNWAQARQDPELLSQIPHVEVNAWLLLSLIAKVGGGRATHK